MKQNKPKLAIVGYGKMGKEIELLAHEKEQIKKDTKKK
jgi:hypothetical protein